MGYEGIMLIDPGWMWQNTKSRKINFCKYKKRRTADLKCIGINYGTGKYTGFIGSLKLQDNSGRIVDVGSGLSDTDRHCDVSHFVSKIIEIEFEQIVATYIQPTFVRVRDDKKESD